jgi:hypothetical protein
MGGKRERKKERKKERQREEEVEEGQSSLRTTALSHVSSNRAFASRDFFASSPKRLTSTKWSAAAAIFTRA